MTQSIVQPDKEGFLDYSRQLTPPHWSICNARMEMMTKTARAHGDFEINLFMSGNSGFLHYLQLAIHELTTIGINATKNEIPNSFNK